MRKGIKSSSEKNLPQLTYEQLLVVTIVQADEIASLKLENATLKRIIFGAKGEKYIPSTPDEQLSLFEPELPITPHIDVVEVQGKDGATPSANIKKERVNVHAGRNVLPAHLPRIEKTIEPAQYLANPDAYIRMGEEVSEKLDAKRFELYVVRTIRPKYALKVQNEDESENKPSNIVIANLPDCPIPKGIAASGLLALILVDKYVDHLPLYRTIKRLGREGVDISDSTMGDWVKQCCEILHPLYVCLREMVLQSGYIQVDETYIKVMDSDQKGATHRGFYWVYRSPEKGMVLFDYQKTRSGTPENAIYDLLTPYQGYLQSDGYVVYDAFEANPNITSLCCMAHARRKFFERTNNKLAQQALGWFAKLYDIEREARQHQLTPDQRHQLRQQKTIPILAAFKEWLDNNLPKNNPKDPLLKAFGYTIHRWTKLCAYTLDGKLEIDNNGVENSIRPIAIGRKNYMFAGSHEGACRAAMLYSLFGECQIHNINPQDWLVDVLDRILAHPQKQLSELLPHQWKHI